MFKFNMQPVPGKGPGIVMFGDYVTDRVKHAVRMVMNDSYIDSPVYKARSDASAFFQGDQDKFVFIEFWTPSKADEFVQILNDAVCPVVAQHLTELHVNLYDYKDKGSMDLCLMIAEETKCEYDASGAFSPFRFKPEYSRQHSDVYNLIRLFELKVIDR